MDQRITRLWAAAEADVLGHGGIAMVERATGVSRTTIRVGLEELRGGAMPQDVVNVRRAGGGRLSIERTSPGIVSARNGAARLPRPEALHVFYEQQTGMFVREAEVGSAPAAWLACE
jgi:hypothetical protein